MSLQSLELLFWVEYFLNTYSWNHILNAERTTHKIDFKDWERWRSHNLPIDARTFLLSLDRSTQISSAHYSTFITRTIPPILKLSLKFLSCLKNDGRYYIDFYLNKKRYCNWSCNTLWRKVTLLKK